MVTALFVLLIGIPVTIILLHLIGTFLPKQWKITCSHSYFVPTKEVNDIVTDVPHFPAWKQLDRCEWVNIHELEWKEYYVGHQILFKGFPCASDNTIQQLSIRNTAPFSVNRTYTTCLRDNMTFLTISDEFIIAQPAMRILSRVLYDHESYLKKEMQQLDQFMQQS